MSGRESTGRGSGNKSSEGRGGGRGRGRGGGGRGGNSNNKRASPSASSSRPRGPKQPRSNVCFHYAKNGTCARGDKCRFTHEGPTNSNNEVMNDAPDVCVVAPMPVENNGVANTPPSQNGTVLNTIPTSGFVSMSLQQPAVQQRAVQPVAAAEPPKLGHITEKRFADLDISAESRRAMSQVFKYEHMTAVQSETLPLILASDSNDCLAKAKTGTGKTLAFMIPTIEKIMVTMSKGSKNRSDVNCLVISPTRELAQQIGTETEKLLTFHKDYMKKVVVCVGGNNKNKDVRALRGTTPIVVATPGRLLDHLQNSDLAQRMANLDVLILDEADQLLDMGFRPDIERILRLIQPSCQTRQTLLFSATIPNSVSQIANIALRPNYHFVDTVGQEAEQTHKHVQQQLMITSQENLIRELFSIMERETNTLPYKIIVFFTTARLTGFMAEMFNSVSDRTGYNVLEIHSRKTQKQRERSSDAFRKQKNAIMFSSDVTARGMDYPDVTFVLQVGLTDRSQYIHRLGRTARAGKSGKGGLLLADYEEYHMTKRELKDMPLELIPVPNTEKSSDAASQAIHNVSVDKVLRNSAEQAYRAWLGYYNGHLKKVQWDKKQLVQQANMWGSEVGLKSQPAIQKRTVGKMGLKGVPGLKLEN